MVSKSHQRERRSESEGGRGEKERGRVSGW